MTTRLILQDLPSVANALATDIFCEVKSSVVFKKKFSGWAGHIHFDRGIFVNGGVRQSEMMISVAEFNWQNLT